jgi:hypothetical protein
LVKRISDNIKEYIMRGTYEAFILVKVKDGKKYVCALNRQKGDRGDLGRLNHKERQDFLEKQVIWN